LASDDYKQARIELETNGLYTETFLKINGEPVHNCFGVEFKIMAGEAATCTVHLENVPIKFTGQLAEETHDAPAVF
jgi:hypothetical protein